MKILSLAEILSLTFWKLFSVGIRLSLECSGWEQMWYVIECI